MKTILAGAVALLSAVGVYATTIDFEGIPGDTIVSAPGYFAGVQFSIPDPGANVVVSMYVPGPDLTGSKTAKGDPFTHSPFHAAFSGTVNFVSVALGDFDADDDNLFLTAYDSGNNVLSTSSAFLSATVNGGPTLSVSSVTPIAYVDFGSTGTYPSSVFFDNFTFTGTPGTPDVLSPGMILPFLLGAFVYLRRRLA